MLPMLLAVDFMNFNYYRIPCSGNVPVPALIRQGKYSYLDKKMTVGFDVYVVTVKEGSLRPGTRQAVVTIGCDFPVGGTSAAYLYDVRGGNAKFVQTVGHADWGGDWGAGPGAIHVRFANRLLYVDSCANDECETSIVRTYAFRGRQIKQIYEQTHPTR
ncbi:MAG: hypothetical protein JO024_02100 [Candidatus Eremiobacteraeota bacterium]|nr:hypothetical protein [Candidatus Eremiobacteraeota bacterium]